MALRQFLCLLLGALCVSAAEGIRRSGRAKARLLTLHNEVYAALKNDAACYGKYGGHKEAQTAKQPSDRCLQLCKNKPGCSDVCDEVRTMICDAPVMQTVAVSSDSQAAAAAAAASAASNAVKAAAKDAIADAVAASKRAQEEAKQAVTVAVMEAQQLARKDTVETANAAAAMATEKARAESLSSAHAVASTAAAAATMAAHAAAAAAAAGDGDEEEAPAPAPAGPAPAPAPAGF